MTRRFSGGALYTGWALAGLVLFAVVGMMGGARSGSGLVVGSYAAQRGNYPLAAALERIRPRDAGAAWQPPLATLGVASNAAGAAALLAPKPPFDWTRSLLWLVLIGGALVVVAMAWSLLRQSRRDGSER